MCVCVWDGGVHLDTPFSTAPDKCNGKRRKKSMVSSQHVKWLFRMQLQFGTVATHESEAQQTEKYATRTLENRINCKPIASFIFFLSGTFYRHKPSW